MWMKVHANPPFRRGQGWARNSTPQILNFRNGINALEDFWSGVNVARDFAAPASESGSQRTPAQF
jgi:hypothetical protein